MSRPVEQKITKRTNGGGAYERSRLEVEYISRAQATPDTYRELGFRCGLEVHQQLLTKNKLFCNCPAGIYQQLDEYDAEIVRHMRPTLSELGEYDGTALMEFKTRKTILYRLNNKTACTYDIDDTPPFGLNRQALSIALEIALMLKTSIVGELHIIRKQYLDGSIPTGFQRTGIIGIDGSIKLTDRTVTITQISIEEDSCREASDIGHMRVYATDRLGMPLIETVTHHDMLTPDQVAEVAQHLRFLVRSSGKVRTGLGAARQDVNVSITGGTRVEIKGVASIRRIPELTHNEAFRQKSLLAIRDQLLIRVSEPKVWKPSTVSLNDSPQLTASLPLSDSGDADSHVVGVNLPQFGGLLSHFTQPGRTFADEISDRLKVIACLGRPNLVHSEQADPGLAPDSLAALRQCLDARDSDAQIVVWASSDDITTALETIEERCLLAFDGVPSETRQARADGTTHFERVLPGPNRMYPDTDSLPISISEEQISSCSSSLPTDLSDRIEQLERWHVPHDCRPFLLRKNLVPLVDSLAESTTWSPLFVAKLFGQRAKKHIEQNRSGTVTRISELVCLVHRRGLNQEVAADLIRRVCSQLECDIEKFVALYPSGEMPPNDLRDRIRVVLKSYKSNRPVENSGARIDFVMGQLRTDMIGRMPMRDVRKVVEQEVGHV